MPRHKGDYQIGYGKPPKHTQFTKGESGNRKGRPKGSIGLVARFMQIVEERIKVTKNGRQCTITKFEASMTQLVNKAASGDMRAIRELHNWVDSLPIERLVMSRPPDLHVHFISTRDETHEQKKLAEMNQDIPKRSCWEASLERQPKRPDSSNDPEQLPNGALNEERK